MTEHDTTAPLILTLGFDEPSFRRFDGERRRHFPRARNHIPAHLTLFHHLPGAEIRRIRDDLTEAASTSAPLDLDVTGLRFLGYGTAYEIASPPLAHLRSDLAARWSDWLTPQDAQAFRPHVTIQNKAPAPQAKALFADLDAAFRPFSAHGASLLLWHYRGGPWDVAGEFPLGA